MEDALRTWDRRTPLLLRIDYGYPLPVSPARQFSLSRTPLRALSDFFSSSPQRTGVAVLNAHHLLSLRRRDGIPGELFSRLGKSDAVLETRFPRAFRKLASIFAEMGVAVAKADVPSDGSLPPLYQKLERNRELYYHHLNYEWESGFAVARGSSVLIDVANLLASSREPVSAGEVARKMGITAGAAASYLKWMEDAALVRKTGKQFLLRHRGLALLFSGETMVIGQLSPARRPDPMDLD